MNWKRVFKYTVIFTLCSIFLGIPFGYIMGSNDLQGETFPVKLYWLLYFLTFLAQTTILFFLTKRLSHLPFIHAFAVVLISSITSMVTLWLLTGQVLGSWQIDYTVLALAILFGTSLGNYARQKNGVINT